MKSLEALSPSNVNTRMMPPLSRTTHGSTPTSSANSTAGPFSRDEAISIFVRRHANGMLQPAALSRI
jgi:hypothetical protein